MNSKAVTCLAYSTGDLLLSGSEDGMVRVWDPRTHNIVRMFRHAKGCVQTNVKYCFLVCIRIFLLLFFTVSFMSLFATVMMVFCLEVRMILHLL